MISPKRQVASESSASEADYERQLKYLYARRSAIDALIESLEEYDRYRETGDRSGVLKTA
jgi:hypothetical protein